MKRMPVWKRCMVPQSLLPPRVARAIANGRLLFQLAMCMLQPVIAQIANYRRKQNGVQY
jgi:hypothetical protein